VFSLKKERKTLDLEGTVHKERGFSENALYPLRGEIQRRPGKLDVPKTPVSKNDGEFSGIPFFGEPWGQRCGGDFPPGTSEERKELQVCTEEFFRGQVFGEEDANT
jgi:hypothetical protein